MATPKNISVTLSDADRAFVEIKGKSPEYRSTSDYVGDLIRRAREAEMQPAVSIEEGAFLLECAREGIAQAKAGMGIPWTAELMADIRQKYRTLNQPAIEA